MNKIRLLIADDSTFVRQALVRALSVHADLEIIGEARDGLHAIELARQLCPDVMTLDLQMPQLSGLDVLRVLRDELPTRIIMVSSFTRVGAEESFRALEEGAFDFVDKTLVRNRMDFVRLGDELIEKIRLAASQVSPAVRIHSWPKTEALAPKSKTPPLATELIAATRALVVVGASTGGPPAIRRFFSTLRPGLPAVFIIVQHMPPGFSGGFAKRLNQTSPLVVHELTDGEVLSAGHAYVIPSGSEIAVEQHGEQVRINLKSGDSDTRHRPSLDHTLRTATSIHLPLKIAVVLTGMGADGREGIVPFAQAGGQVLVQDEGSCIIYGMPKAVKETIKPDLEAPPEVLGQHVVEQLVPPFS